MSTCKYGEQGCGTQYYCGRCEREASAAAYKRMSEADKAYDRYVDPKCAYHTDFPTCCSCHLSAPCSFCTDGNQNEH